MIFHLNVWIDATHDIHMYINVCHLVICYVMFNVSGNPLVDSPDVMLDVHHVFER